ncbi:MAG: ABC transporter permease [Actinobacteria bacterium]|nr:ABC transporter permease [Actinomycetota bacterium]MBV8957241.1 ABC transporter permease [Actinomycetota bacterium]
MPEALAVTGRYVRRFWRTPQLLFFGAVQPVVFVVGLNAVFGGVVSAFLGTSYIQYVVPGVLVMNVMLLAGTTAAGLAEDMQSGIIDRFRSLPMNRSAVLVGRTAADLARNVITVTAVVVSGFVMGYHLRGGAAAGIAAIAVVLAFGYAVSWLFASIGLAVKDPAAAQFAGFAPVLPLVYVSGAWIPLASMHAGIRAFARNQPVSVVTEAVRALGDGTPAGHWLLLSLLWSAAIFVVFAALSTWQYRRIA